MRRVVVTGLGSVSPLGGNAADAAAALREGRHGIVCKPEWTYIDGLSSRLAGEVLAPLPHYPRKRVRTMGRVAILGLAATEAAIASAGLTDDQVRGLRTGLIFGSTHGSSQANAEFCEDLLVKKSLVGMPGSTYLKFMSHTCAANLAQALGIVGRVIPVISACTSASQSIGVGYETVRAGVQDIALCGGAEELHPVHAAVFDLVYAASAGYNDRPDESPRPFDRDRDGLVVAEGAGCLVLEDLDYARARGAVPLAEVVGFGTCCDGTHVTAPSADGMAQAMRLALQDAGIDADQIEYLNGHATATTLGDIAESKAVASVFGDRVPFSSTKGHTGHTLGACGAIEAGFCLASLEDGFLPPTRNLVALDENCAPLNYIQGQGMELKQPPKLVMSTNFAFGGINTALVFRAV